MRANALLRGHTTMPNSEVVGFAVQPRWTRQQASLLGFFALVVCLATPNHARAEVSGAGACEQVLTPWLQACTPPPDTLLRPVGCPPGRFIVRASFSGSDAPPPLDFELQPGANGFRQLRGYSLSPVGEFENWAAAPAPARAALDSLLQCIDAHADKLPPAV
ncbi:MAG: hypothetical protein ACPG77_14405, partial [Nannocystaceae bacterium]